MALHINIEDLLNKRKVESDRIEFKRGWNPVDIYHTICAFANDIDNLGGGYILVGVEEENGVAKRPVTGVPIDKLDGIQKDMQRYNQLFTPFYAPKISVEEVDGKYVFAIWAKAGMERPYSIPSDVNAKLKKPIYYVRYGTSSIEAKGEMKEDLMNLANREPFDERPNPKIKIEDISMVLLRDHLVKVGSRLANELWKQPLEDILDQMGLYAGPSEDRMLRNVAAMMFCEDPSKFFPYTQIDVVTFPNGKIADPNNFTEKTFKGSVPQMINSVMGYLKGNVLKEYVHKVDGKQEADRYWNYPYEALEESVTNSLYHRDYQQYEPVEITVEPDSISILNCPGPDRSISKEAIEKGDSLKNRRYRNRRLGDFLKELDLTEGRSTGIPTIQSKLAANGSPRATFETTEDRLTFLIIIPVHEGCTEETGSEKSSVQIAESSEKTAKSSESCSEKTIKSSERPREISEKSSETKKKSSETKKKSSERILELIEQKPSITIAELAMTIGISSRGIEKNIRILRENGIIRRVGSDFVGHWEIIPK